jgi:predicted phage terminase large subunit-like protein
MWHLVSVMLDLRPRLEVLNTAEFEALAPSRQVVRYERAFMYPKQKAALFVDERYAVVEASTKSGKTVGCLVWLHEQAALHGAPGRNYWWIAPIRRVAKIAYRRLKIMLDEGPGPEWYESNETEMTVTLMNGATIFFLGSENPDTLYGEDVYACVIDEATRVKQESWWAIRTTLTATEGPVRIIGNVKGRRNWAYKLARHAERGLRTNYHYAKLTVWDAVEAGIFPTEEAEDARELLPEAVYKELYLAEAADESEVFFRVEEIGTIDEAPPDLRVVRTWDFAVTEEGEAADPDYTVGVKMGFDGRRTVIIDVVSRRAAPDTITELVQTTAVADGASCQQIIEEEKGAAGKMMVALFKRMLADLAEPTGWVFPAPVTGSKPVRAFHFAAACNDKRVVLVKADWNAGFLEELDDFPDEGHDDQVDAAAHGYNHLVPARPPRADRYFGE